MPPAGVTVAVPFASPLQFTSVLLIVAVRIVGWMTSIVLVISQFLLSFTVTVYVPAVKPVAVAVG